MNSTAAIAAMTAVLKGLGTCGPNVYGQIRYSRDPAAYDSLFLDSTLGPEPFVHAWMVTRETVKVADQNMQAAKATHAIVAIGYRSFRDDITEPLWQQEIDEILAALIPYSGRHLQGEGQGVYFDWSGPPQVEGIKLVFFGNVVCHTARIVFPIEEYPLN